MIGSQVLGPGPWVRHRGHHSKNLVFASFTRSRRISLELVGSRWIWPNPAEWERVCQNLSSGRTGILSDPSPRQSGIPSDRSDAPSGLVRFHSNTCSSITPLANAPAWLSCTMAWVVRGTGPPYTGNPQGFSRGHLGFSLPVLSASIPV